MSGTIPTIAALALISPWSLVQIQPLPPISLEHLIKNKDLPNILKAI